jgi:N-acetylglucosamine malate deacetylase 1
MVAPRANAAAAYFVRGSFCDIDPKTAKEQPVTNVVLSILAHPDDAEFLCAGTLIRLRDLGWEVHLASMTPGDCGSTTLPPDEIARVRRAEGARAAALIGAAYHCVEERDLRIFYAEQPLERVVRLLRHVRPRIVLTHSPADYILDHEVTSTLTRAATFGAPAPNLFRDSGHATVLEQIPHLYYCDAIEGKDLFGRPVEAAFRIDVSSAIEKKAAMLTAHASQRAWLLKHHGMDQYVESMRAWGARQGSGAGVAYAEGFRQHLGHSYPQDNLLGEILGIV